MSKNYITLAVIIVVVLVFGIFLLNAMGQLFISEIVQEVVVEEVSGEVVGIDINKKAPHWELAGLAVDKVALSDFLGEPLVLTFWTTWNPKAADQIKIFDEYLSQNNETIFKIVAINSQEDKSVVSSFMRRGEYQVKVLLDESGAVGELYKARNLPITFFLDREGIVRDIFIGVLSEKALLEKVEAIID